MLYSFLSFSNMAPFLYLCMLSVLASSVAALNDWTKACLAGECSYDLAASSLHIVSVLSPIYPVPSHVLQYSVWFAYCNIRPHIGCWLADS